MAPITLEIASGFTAVVDDGSAILSSRPTRFGQDVIQWTETSGSQSLGNFNGWVTFPPAVGNQILANSAYGPDGVVREPLNLSFGLMRQVWSR
jgi:hypothetical protein